MTKELLQAINQYYKYNYLYSYGNTGAVKQHAKTMRDSAVQVIENLTGQSYFATLKAIKGNK